jgi:hypothetical protein
VNGRWLIDLVIGRQPLRHIDRAPNDVVWRSVRPKPSAEPVRADLARSSGLIETERGKLRYEAGKHYIVQYGPGDRAPVLRDLFERTYRRRDDGRFEKRTDVVLRYFTLSYPVMVETLEGVELAHPGDVIMEGATGELWPMSPHSAQEKYERA